MKARRAGAAVVAMALVGAAASGCAMMQRRSPEELVAERQQLMKRQGAALTEIQDKLKQNDVRGVATNAATLAETSKKIPALFPEGSLTPKSNAKPEIWQKRSEFEDYAKKLNTDAERLRTAAASNDANATQAIMKDLPRTTCASCHNAFRKPLPK